MENSAYPGTPDVNCTEGWIELKKILSWPVKKGIVQLPHFTPQQRVWLQRRWVRGGGAWLLLQVGRSWLLFDGLTAGKLVGHLNQEQLIKRALRVWGKGLKDDELIEALNSTKPKINGKIKHDCST